MVKIRLRRMGKKGQPSYRIVVAEATSPRDGRFIETLGHYNPITDPETVKYDQARALYWLSVGAQPSDAVKRFLQRDGLYDLLPRVHAGEDPTTLVDTSGDETLAPMTAAPVEQEVAALEATAAAAAEETPNVGDNS